MNLNRHHSRFISILLASTLILTGCSSVVAPEPSELSSHNSKNNTGALSDDTASTSTDTTDSTPEATPTPEPAEPIPYADASGRDFVRVMSYNCFTTTKAGTEYNGGRKNYKRWQILRDTLAEQGPDSIGLQEITNEWKDCIETNIVSEGVYAIAGFRSDDGQALKSGSTEYSPILYRADLYELEAEGGFWLSDTPDVPSSYPTMKFKRVAAYVVLRSKATGDIAYIHVNTHFDHKSSDAVNTDCSRVLTDRVTALVEKYDCPVAITGDFNSHEYAEAYKYLAEGEHGLYDSKYLTEDREDYGSFPGYWQDFSRMADTDPIDHIFVTDTFGCRTHTILDNRYFSDHSAVLADLLF